MMKLQIEKQQIETWVFVVNTALQLQPQKHFIHFPQCNSLTTLASWILTHSSLLTPVSVSAAEIMLQAHGVRFLFIHLLCKQHSAVNNCLKPEWWYKHQVIKASWNDRNYLWNLYLMCTAASQQGVRFGYLLDHDMTCQPSYTQATVQRLRNTRFHFMRRSRFIGSSDRYRATDREGSFTLPCLWTVSASC